MRRPNYRSKNKKDKKQQQSFFEYMILEMIRKSIKAALHEALDDFLKESRRA